MSISLDEAVELTRTGDLWVFRGRSVPDRAIQLTTNSPVNHVGMAVVLDDMPPLMWHAELGRSLPDLWTGTHQRGVQLHDLRDAVCVWANRYGQRGWLRQLEPPADAEMERSVLRTIARLDGTPFPSTAQLAWRWVRGRVPSPRLPLPAFRRRVPAVDPQPDPPAGGARDLDLETAYCAEVVAVTYEAMGLLPVGRRPNWYDPGRFWSGDDLGLHGGARLGSEIEVRIPPR
ncbi:hypothetical protein ACN26Z_22100 [Verrucosispora sp. WMMD703]|uniref:hypothetical protein n=1 Tax=unclassified Micromonospora TaxID=2617518 RepID=UPI002499D20D|nr:hypothetical protein [Verrucosispora sp. WMMD1129]WFE47433.1 hypothetical protein O7624_25470 [Verrucosispora sp. WMMD1129]